MALATVAPLLERCGFRFVDAPASDEAMAALRGAETIGRPLGSPAFLDRLAALTGRDLSRGNEGQRRGLIGDLVCRHRNLVTSIAPRAKGPSDNLLHRL